MIARLAMFGLVVSAAFAVSGQNVYRDGRLISGPDARRGGHMRGGYGGHYRNPGERGGRYHGGTRSVIFPTSSELHRPWAGSDTYEKNKNAGRERDGGRSDFQRDRDSTLDVYHREEDRARAVRENERIREERRQAIRENKEAIARDRESARRAKEAREADQLDEIRYRAAEKERAVNERHDKQAEEYDKIMRSLKPCRAYNADGTPCTKKANPGIPFCHKHVGYTGKMQPDEKGAPK